VERTDSVGYHGVMAMQYAVLLTAAAACVELADELGPETPLAGRWILDRAKMKMPGIWLPNFKPFVTLGILTQVSGSRGGRRAYYRIVDCEGSNRALLERGVPLQTHTAAATG
jgi:hypothetical protein